MTSFVRHSLSLVIVRSGPARERTEKVDDAVVLGVASVARGERRVAEEARTGTGFEANGVEVERGGAALAKSPLHGGLLGAGGESGGMSAR